MRRLRLAGMFLGLAIGGVAACGGGDAAEGGDGGRDELAPCRTGDCGRESFRRAIPGRGTVRIDFQSATARRLSETPAGRLGARPPELAHLEAVAPGYVALGEHVDEINQVVDELFAELDDMASGTPEIEEDTVHQWRQPDLESADLELVLRLESADEESFDLEVAAGPTGFAPTEADVFMAGTMTLDDGAEGDFALTIDFDVVSQIAGGDLTGTLDISSEAEPASGEREIWYDYTDFGLVGDELETSITTYWVFGDGDGALEYLDALRDSDATVYARWNEAGGRIDHHVLWFDADQGELEEIGTDCWAGAGAETFFGSAVFDELGDAYVQVDGDEADCAFGPLADHPDPGEEFDGMPGEGEWDDLAESSSDYCELDPGAPDCADFCELFPDEPECLADVCEEFPDLPECDEDLCELFPEDCE